jgi:hypothetical protein
MLKINVVEHRHLFFHWKVEIPLVQNETSLWDRPLSYQIYVKRHIHFLAISPGVQNALGCLTWSEVSVCLVLTYIFSLAEKVHFRVEFTVMLLQNIFLINGPSLLAPFRHRRIPIDRLTDT